MESPITWKNQTIYRRNPSNYIVWNKIRAEVATVFIREGNLILNQDHQLSFEVKYFKIQRQVQGLGIETKPPIMFF